MANDTKNGIMCHACKRVECIDDYPQGIPSYCLATRFHDVMERTKTDYAALETAKIYLAAGKVIAKGSAKWPRVKEAIEFAKELGVSKIGLASCVALIRELSELTRLLEGAGFEIVSAGCQVGRVSPTERGAPKEYTQYSRGLYCNPIAQAEILNKEGTELNFVIGLCLGHDILFHKFSKAPASTLIVKDRVTGNNPSGALLGWHLRRALEEEYCGKAMV